jgi:hypothetical protein
MVFDALIVDELAAAKPERDMRPPGCSSFTTFHKLCFGWTFAEEQHRLMDRRRCPSRRSLIASTLQPERVRDKRGGR